MSPFPIDVAHVADWLQKMEIASIWVSLLLVLILARNSQMENSQLTVFPTSQLHDDFSVGV